MSKLNKLFPVKTVLGTFAILMSICLTSCQKEELPPTNDEINSEVGAENQKSNKQSINYIDASLPNDLIAIEDPT